MLVVLALESDRVARWARNPESPWPVVPFAPVVLGPESIATLTTSRAGSASVAAPELPVLAAMAQLAARERTANWAAEVRAAVRAALSRALASIRLISSAEKQAHLLALLHSVARNPEARAILREQLEEDGMNTLERIKKSARLEGKAEGVALGEAKGKADGLLRLLRRRGFEVHPLREAEVLRTTNVRLLDAWFDRAIDAETIDAVFAQGQPGT